MSEGYLWGDAEVTYPDWVGTAQLDEKMTTPSIHDVIDLDHDEWMIVGLDIGGGEHDHDIRVMAVRKDPNLQGPWVAVDIAANNNGEIPVKEFLVHDADPYDVLKPSPTSSTCVCDSQALTSSPSASLSVETSRRRTTWTTWTTRIQRGATHNRPRVA